MIEEFTSVWNFRLLVIDTHPITVGKLLIALGVAIVGIIIVGILNRVLGNRLLTRTRFKETTASTIRKMLPYFAYVLVLLFALRLLNVPLTAFAFLGGAIAIGEATEAYSWFSGYYWRMAFCRHCGQHLGWHYEAVSRYERPLEFWGILAVNLKSM